MTGCGTSGGEGEGWVAVGAAGPRDDGGSARNVPPEDGVALTPLERDDAERQPPAPEPPDEDAGTPAPPPGTGSPPADGATPGGDASGSPEETPGDGADTGDGDEAADDPDKGKDKDRTGPALLEVGKPEGEKAGDRWCEKVTVAFRNEGGEPVTSGTVRFATHVIGALGVDWATVTSERELPVPLEAGEKKEKTWKLCVDPWRVPLGMRVDTREVKASGWKD
ncbi:hypothetical protein [Streptomyces sp. HNM0574]|uniref:hypothetical protein n=1 Tax=Streptomyces sp. HNM0574 TaxID=2714954 RepID=UPI001F103F6B|nr:hypothetical protein [Streptomyces sp. HNM0574]